MSRSTTATLTRLSQAGAAVLLAGSVGVAALGLPGSRPERPPEDLAPPTLTVEAPVVRAEAREPDIAAISTRLGALANSPKPAEPPPSETGAEPPPPPPPEERDIKYLGRLVFGDRRLAIINDAGSQRIVAVGDSITDSGNVESIEATVLTLVRDGSRREIELAQRSGGAVAMTGALPTFQAPVQRAPSMSGMNQARFGASAPGGNMTGLEEDMKWREFRAQELRQKIAADPSIPAGDQEMFVQKYLEEEERQRIEERRQRMVNPAGGFGTSGAGGAGASGPGGRP